MASKKYRVYGKVTGSIYLGIFEAESAEEAIEIANEEAGGPIALCHECAGKCEDAVVEPIEAELEENP